MSLTPEVNKLTGVHAKRFPWRWIAAFMLFSGYVGARLTLAAIHQPPLGLPRLGLLIVTNLAVVGVAWRVLRTTVRDWQLEFAKDLEYAARRTREAEDGLRFRGP